MADNNASYKLIYFNSRGGAELIRLVFAVAGVEYEDERVTDWPSKKKDMPQEMLPVLEIDDRKVCQSNAICRYLARKFNLYGKTEDEGLEIDEITETCTDMANKLTPVIFGKTSDEEKAKGVKEVMTSQFPKYETFLCNKLKESKSGFLVGDEMTFADIHVYRVYDFLKDIQAYDRSDQLLKDHYTKVAGTPQIAGWVAKRPVTKM